MTLSRTAGIVLATTMGAALALLGPARGQQVHRNGFETRGPVWVRGAADAPFRELAHALTDQSAHTGQSSEHIQLQAERGHFIHYVYPIGRAPVGDELTASVWVRANRPGMQLLARLVLPHEPNPENINEKLTTLLRGDPYQLAGRWQRLALGRPVKLAREQQQLMRAQLKRDVDFTDAYVDNLVLNLYAGPGATEVWIDDLEVGPVLDGGPFQTTGRAVQPRDTRPLVEPRAPGRAALVEMSQDQLLVGGKRFLMRGIRYSDTPLKTLRDAGFNTLWLDFQTPPAAVEEAVNLGFWVVPAVPVTGSGPHVTSPDALNQEVTRFLAGDAVLFWDLGNVLASEEAHTVAAAAKLVRAADPQRPLGADVRDGLRSYSLGLDLVGLHRWPLMTGLDLVQYRDWLTKSRLLARPGTFTWTWVQTHLPDWYTNLVYERSPSAGFEEPIGPQPEQIRLLTYNALAAGCRGVAFWSDRFLADTHQGRDRLLALALLNQELQMLEPLLLTAEAPIWVDTSIGEVKAAVMRTQYGILVLPVWLGSGAQFVPGQSAASKLTVVVPEVPAGRQAWEISPANVRSLQTERVPGGWKVTVPEFGLTCAILFSAVDNNPNGMLVRFQDQTRRLRKLAAQWAHDLAEVEMDKVLKVEARLEQAGHTLRDGKELQDNARQRLRTSVDDWNNGDFHEAYAEAERAVRPLRIMMRAQWEEATRTLDSPVASPYAVSFFTLPRHWRFMEEVKQASAGANVLPDGGFELGPERAPTAWIKQETTLDDVVLAARPSADQPKEGHQCLMLEIKPKDPQGTPPEALERTYLAIRSPDVRVQPGSLVQVSGWVRIPKPITASPDGALLFDSAGGEPLAVRLTEAKEWKKFTLYRRVPPSGTVSVTLALTGLGTAYFDDIRIQPLVPGGKAPSLAYQKDQPPGSERREPATAEPGLTRAGGSRPR
jgi:hypothetical protein